MTKSFSFYDQMCRQTASALYLYVDIETIPSQDPAVLEAIRARYAVAPVDLDTVKADARLTDPAKIEADIEKKRVKAVDDHAAAVAKAEASIDEEWRKTALDASTGQIVSASAAVAEFAVEHVAVDDLSADAERELLEDLFAGLKAMLEAHAIAQAEKAWDAMRRESMDGREVELIKNGDYVRSLQETLTSMSLSSSRTTPASMSDTYGSARLSLVSLRLRGGPLMLARGTRTGSSTR